MEFKEPSKDLETDSGKAEIKDAGRAQEDIQIMKELEEQIPGSVQLLQEKYGIKEFHRYPIEVLIAQVQQENEQLPYGLMVLPENDPNGAFSNLKPAILNLYKQLLGRYALKVAESGSKFDLARKFISLNTKYGNENKIGFLFLGGHGLDQGKGLMLGEYDTEIPRQENLKKGNAIWNEESESSSVKTISEKYLNKDAEIVFLSCSTGIKEGVAEMYSASLERKTTAPIIFVQLSNLQIKVSYDENSKPHFKTIFQNEEALSAVYDHRPPSEESAELPSDTLNYF